MINKINRREIQLSTYPLLYIYINLYKEGFNPSKEPFPLLLFLSQRLMMSLQLP